MFIFAFHPDLLVTFTTEKNFLFMLTYMFSRQKKKKQQLYLRRVTHNNNSTDELVAPDSKSTISRIKMYSYKTDRQLYWNLS